MNILAYVFSLNILFGVAEKSEYKDLNRDSSVTPILMMNFYLMGKTEIDQDVIFQIGENVDYLNQEFEGVVKFELNKMFLEEKHRYLPDIFKSYRMKSRGLVSSLVSDIEEEGAINVYLLDTYAEGGANKALMGFTPILSRMQNTYALNTPRFDRMFIAYPGLEEKSTLIHEMGHFLGLSHPWEMSENDQNRLGLKKEILYKNHMTYNFDVDSFTPEQLEYMQNFALKYRSYLMKSL